ncbi:hypothetical protein EJ110_NYTH46313 [Nymphaea thermarum]|nr:hypothetical protein EJ110_NYTH46313 [Nymphaea thermarum]
MSKITKWKSEKTKVKVVFRLQFHATHVRWDKLFVSFIPMDTGKVTAKTTKANVRNGNCKWSDPVYETTRLLQDHGNKKYDDKLYKLVVAMGSSRSSILGDATINLADYADAGKPVSISLPLQGCTYGTVLHVTVQLLTSKTGFREFEQQRELRERGIQMLTGSGIQHETDSKVAVFSEASNPQNEKASAKVRVKSDGGFPILEVEGEMNEDIADSVVNADGSSCTSESLYTEKHDNSSTHENESLKSTVSGDMGHLSNNQITGLENVGVSVHQLMPQGSADWVHGWCSNISLYNDSAAVYEENSKLRACLEAAQSSILDLKLEVSTLKTQTHEMVSETQNLAEQLVVEIASGEEWARTISSLKLECAKFKDDFEKIKLHNGNSKAVGPLIYANEQIGRTGAQYGQYNLLGVQNKYGQPGNVSSIVNLKMISPLESSDFFTNDSEEDWLQSLFLLEDKIKIIKGKACLQNLESDLGLVADLESLEHLILGLRHCGQNLAHSLNAGLMTKSDLHDPVKGPESTSLLEKTSGVAQFQKYEGIPDNTFHHAGVLSMANVKQCHRQGFFHCSNVSNSMPVELGHDVFIEMKEKINGLCKELDESRAENSNLTKKMDQMECYYETLIHQLEESQQLMHAELQAVKDSHCSCIYTIATLESEAQKLQKENDEQFSKFLAEKHALSSVNLELEKRALISEMALARLRQNYSLSVDQLLKDLETLSFQVLSMYETNEDLARQPFTDAAQPSLERSNGEKSEEACSPLVKFDSINTLLKAQHITKRYGTQADAFLIDKSQKGSLQAKTVSLESEGHVAVKECHGAESKDAYFNSSEVQDLQGTYKDKHYKLSKPEEDREVDNAYLVALNRRNGDLMPQLEQLSSEQTLLADEAVSVGKHLKGLSANNLFSCQKDEVCVPSDFSRSGSDSLLSDKVEILEYQSENKELKRRMSELDFLLEETKHSLFLQGNLQQKSENKLKDMEMLNLYLEIFSLVLLETARGAQSEIMVMQGKHDELIRQLQQSTSLKELLIIKLQAASDHVKVLQENEAKCNVRYDELVLKYNFVENNLQDLLKEKNVLIEKLKDSEMRIIDLVDFKHKYDACTVEKEEMKHLLEKEKWEKVNLQNEILSLKSYLKTLRLDLDKELSIRADREKTVASLQYRLENLRRKMSSFNESIVGGVTGTNTSKELNGKDIEEAFSHLEQLQQEACGKFLQLSEEKKDTENKLGHLESQITMIKEKAEADAKILVKKLEASCANSENVHGELAEMTKKYMLATEAGKSLLQEKTKLLEELSGVKMEMQSVFKEKNILAQKVSSSESAAEELNQTKVILNDCISENKGLKISLQSANEESIKQVTELACLKETLRCLQDELHSVGGSKEKLETELANIASQLNEKQHMDLKRLAELEFLLEETKVSLTLKEELLQKMGHEMAEKERLNVYSEIFSLVLHETLTGTHAGSMSLKEKNEELTRQLGHAIESKELLMLKLQRALATIEALQENVAKSMSKYDDLILQNTALEEKMHCVVEENSHFDERFKECEVMAVEALSYRQKYDICNAEKEKIQNLFEQENLQRVTLENEAILLKESLKTLKLNLDKESSKRYDQEKILAFLEGRLQELRRKMIFFGEGTIETAGTDLSTELHGEDMRTIVSYIEELLHKALEKFHQFHREKEESEERWNIAQRSLKHAESQHLLVKEKSEMDVKILTAKLDESNSKLEQLHSELVDITSKYKIASEMEEKHVLEKRELSAEILNLKVELQAVTVDNKNLLLKLFSLENSIEELENYRKMLDNYTSENRSLSSSLQIARDESIQHMRKLDCLKGRIQELGRKMFSFGDSNPVETATGLPKEFDCQDIETAISHVEDLHHKALEKFLQCYQEKKESEEQRDFSQKSLKNAESHLLLVKEKSEIDMQILFSKLEESNAKLEQLHAELTDMSAKYKVASEMDEKHVKENMILAAQLSDLKVVLQSVTEEKENLFQKVFTLENSSKEEIENTKQILNDYILENERLSISLQTARDESVQQIKEMNILNGRLQELRRKLFFFGESSVVETNAIDLPRELDCQDAGAVISDVEKLQHKALEKFLQCYQKKKESEEERDLAQRSLKHVESQLLLLKEKSEMDMKVLVANRDESNASLEQLHAELTDITSKYMVTSEIEEKLIEENRKLSVELSDMKVMLQSITVENKNLLQKIFSLENSSYVEIENHKKILDDYISDNKNLSISLQIARDESIQQMRDLNSLKEHCKCLEEELHCLKESKDELEAAFAHVTLELNEKHEQMVSFSEQKAELMQLRKQVSDLLVDNSNMRDLLFHSEECQGRLREDIKYAESKLCDLENNMVIAQESLLKADIEVTFLKSQLHSKVAELCNQIAALQNHQMKLHLKLQATGMALDDQMANEAQGLEQNARLTLDLLSSRSELNTSAGEGFRDVSNDQPNVERFKNDSEIEHLNGIVMCLEEEAEVLRSSRDELDITNLIFVTKLDELNNHIACLNEYGDELNKLRIQHSELSQRLSEQVLKTEEFRNLSICLQELKPRTESSQVNERKAADGPFVASQESLRIAFIREQCETKLQDLRSQLHLSRKHGEELLLKLQIALDELEARKKSEAICMRKNEDLSARVLELEAELQSLLDNMREMVKDNNQLNTELEVSRLSLICCKEEKENLEISLQEYQNQRMKLLLELSSAKEKLKACTACQSQQGLSAGEGLHGKQIYNSYNGTSSTDPLYSSNKDPLHGEDFEATQSLLNEETNPFPLGNAELKGTSPENSRLLLVNKGRQADEDREDLEPVNRHIQEKNLFSSMERLQKELEKMKNENLAPLLDQNGHQTDMVYEERFEREVSQLNVANEQLGRIFPQFNEFLESGNALERVLALEIELAEALKSKKKDERHFQSSFLKQHHDEEAICKSFRDINELIKDMLELKKKNTTVETELKEMHNRYSQLSVQFAEVEGERQKLVMTLKNIRTTRKA